MVEPEPSRVGPYRRLAPLGAGGMGEVWEGWDERLDRRVALKRIRPAAGRAAEPRQRERLRREARAMARLSHPAVVQIYDVVETAEEDWIVLEHVEGRSLADVLRDGPVGLDRLLPLAREIADGLAEAHAKGILHRDLKTENVMVTPAGHAKILDFGLARRVWPRLGEEALSADGALVGTSRAMSPEQAAGDGLDERSDLFSLGTLLYEAVTGISPFAAETRAATRTRVCVHQPPPVRELHPEVPEELSDLIDQLLAKERDRRPRHAREVADRLAGIAGSAGSAGTPPAVSRARSNAAGPTADPTLAMPSSEAFHLPRRGLVWLLLGAAVLAVSALVWSQLARRQPLYVAVARPVVRLGAGREETALAAAGVQEALLRGLVSLQGVAPLEAGSGRPDPAAPESQARALAKALAADEVLTASLDCQAWVCRAGLSRVRGADGSVLWTESLDVPIENLSLLDSALRAALRRAYPRHAARPGHPELGARSEDFAAYLRLGSRLREEGTPSDELLAAVTRLRRAAPRFLEAYLLEAQAASARFFSTRAERDLEQALQALREARQLAPDDPRPLLTQADVALRADRLEDAEAALRTLERLIPADVRVLRLRALVLERQGRSAEAAAQLRSVVRLRPSRDHLLILTNLELRRGEAGAARSTLETMLRSFPSDREGQSLLAQLELLSGSPARAAELYADLVRRSPRLMDLSNLGYAYLLMGRYADAAATFRRAAALAPDSAAVALNLADAELLLGRRRQADALYRRVLELAARDPAPGYWNTLTIQAQALAHLGRPREAVAAVQKALQTAPDNPQASYEAALVYALIGETASAEVHAERALAGGVERRWFDFPWFASLRLEPASAAP